MLVLIIKNTQFSSWFFGPDKQPSEIENRSDQSGRPLGVMSVDMTLLVIARYCCSAQSDWRESYQIDLSFSSGWN